MKEKPESKKTIIGAVCSFLISDGANKPIAIHGVVKEILSLTGTGDWWVVVHKEAENIDLWVNPNNIVICSILKPKEIEEPKNVTEDNSIC